MNFCNSAIDFFLYFHSYDDLVSSTSSPSWPASASNLSRIFETSALP